MATTHDQATAGIHPDVTAPTSLPTASVNVGEMERIASAAGGAALLAIGLSRGSLRGLLAAAAGGALLYRGLSGRCMVYESLGLSTAGCASSQAICRMQERVAEEGRAALDGDDLSDEASYDSFPASDPPSIR
jgi:hypothetical protein